MMESISKENKLRLWYEQQAADWNEALPLGNGRLGAMVFGGTIIEHIQLNEDSLWYGGPLDRNNPSAREYLPQIRELLFAGKTAEAEELAIIAFSGTPWTMRRYQTLGDLIINNAHPYDISGYTRELDLETGTAHVTYKADGVVYTREYFISAVHQVLAIRFTADKPGALSLLANLSRLNEYDWSGGVLPDTIAMKGITGGAQGISFCAALTCIANQGAISVIGEHLEATDADSVLLLLSAATSFRSADCLQAALQCLERAKSVPYDQLRRAHTADYRALWNRVSFSLAPAGRRTAALPVDKRLKRIKRGAEDQDFVCLYFQYCRYLLISCSRPGTLPANLQGIWNPSLDPPWGSKYTININLQMNYWPAETCNLAECHLPLFDLVKRMQEPGQRTAQVMYGCRGFTAHHNTDIWADTAPQDVYLPATYWPLGAAWLCLHFWEHYLFGQDMKFLKEAYSVMKNAALFFLDFLVEDRQGRLVTCPSVSPENIYALPGGEKGCLAAGPAMDTQIIRALYEACIQAAGILDTDTAFCRELAAVLEKLPALQTGKHGQLLEWADEYDEAEPGHRHISHLFALHPSNQITLQHTPELAAAARKTLERRLKHGSGHTGWSRAWIINLWARLADGDKAYNNLQALLEDSTLPNLFDTHPPFQIDGNFGTAAGIAEMLLQSHAGEIVLLPALPLLWQTGRITGLRARGGYSVDIAWQRHKLTEAVIRAACTGAVTVRYSTHTQQVKAGAGACVVLNGELHVK